MALADLTDWLYDQAAPNILWYVKRLSANDTLATGAHQAGPYIPKELLFRIFPSMNRPDAENPDKRFELRIDSHGDVRPVRAVWYNNRLRGGTRNEARLTNFGGGSSAVLDPDSTGALAIFAFHSNLGADASVCHGWVCDHETQAEQVEDLVGPVEPGGWKIWSVNREGLETPAAPASVRAACWLEPNEIPAEWLTQFPTGAEIIRKTIELRPVHGDSVDLRLLKRRECEFEIFRSVEQAVELPEILRGFGSVEDFVSRAQTILQRRKARSGRSLELHTRAILLEERLQEGTEFSHGPESEASKRPDFLFPSESAYKNPAFPTGKLRMLAAKTTCKDRWRQILNEADRIPHKHLLTLQEGVSEGQFREMTEAKIKLVVPQPLISAYPAAVQPHLQTLESFVADIRLLSQT